MSPNITGLAVALRTCRQPSDDYLATFQSGLLHYQILGVLTELNKGEKKKNATCLFGLLAQVLA